MKKLFLLINFILIGCSLLSYASPFISPKSFPFSSLMGLAYVFLLIGNILFIFFWLLVEWKHALWSFVVLFLGLPIMFKYYGISNHEQTKVDFRKELKIASYNIQSSKYSNYSDQQMAKSLAREHVEFLRQIEDVGVLCGQEVSYKAKSVFEEAFGLAHIHSYPDRQTVIFSRYPILDKGQIDFGTRQNSCIWADIDFNGEKLRIYNVHLESNKLTKDAEKVLEKGDLQTKQTWKHIGGIFQRYSMNAENRVFQVRRIVAHKKSCPHKAIVCGDFNDVPQSFTYNFISQGMKDSFIEKGKGIGSTYAGPVPGLRIDYILSDPAYKILDHEVFREKYSDHYPIAAHIRLTDDGTAR